MPSSSPLLSALLPATRLLFCVQSVRAWQKRDVSSTAILLRKLIPTQEQGGRTAASDQRGCSQLTEDASKLSKFLQGEAKKRRNKYSILLVFFTAEEEQLLLKK